MKPSLRPTVRTPMALVLMVAIAFGWIGHEARTQRMAVAATKRSGGEVTYSWQKFVGTFPRGAPPASRWLVDQLGCDYFGHLTTVVLNGPAATDDTTRQVARLGRVRGLIPDDTTVTDSGLAPLRGLIHLDFLSLDGNPGIKGPGLANIRELRQLRRLNIENTKLDDADLIPVARLTSLTYMNLFYTPITDVGLGHLGNTVNLEALYTSGGMTRLERLDLGGTRVADLSPIRGLSRIGMLMLSRTSVTDSGLAHLVGLTKSREIGLSRTAVTDAGIAEFWRARPTIKLNR